MREGNDLRVFSSSGETTVRDGRASCQYGHRRDRKPFAVERYQNTADYIDSLVGGEKSYLSEDCRSIWLRFGGMAEVQATTKVGERFRKLLRKQRSKTAAEPTGAETSLETTAQ